MGTGVRTPPVIAPPPPPPPPPLVLPQEEIFIIVAVTVWLGGPSLLMKICIKPTMFAFTEAGQEWPEHKGCPSKIGMVTIESLVAMTFPTRAGLGLLFPPVIVHGVTPVLRMSSPVLPLPS